MVVLKNPVNAMMLYVGRVFVWMFENTMSHTVEPCCYNQTMPITFPACVCLVVHVMINLVTTLMFA
jgi:hypothetical protein